MKLRNCWPLLAAWLAVPVHFSIASDLPAAAPAAPDRITAASAPAPAAGTVTNTPFSPWSAEVARLAEAQISEDIVLTYVEECAGTFNLNADQIIRLQRAGASATVINAMMHHDTEILAGIRVVSASTVPASTPFRLVVIPGSQNTNAPSASQSAPALQPLDEPVDLVAQALAAMQVNESPASAATISPATKPAYAVRAPYPEPISPPLIIYRNAQPTPNMVIVVYSH